MNLAPCLSVKGGVLRATGWPSPGASPRSDYDLYVRRVKNVDAPKFRPAKIPACALKSGIAIMRMRQRGMALGALPEVGLPVAIRGRAWISSAPPKERWFLS